MNINKQEKYDEITDFHKGFACVKQGDKWGYINEKGTLITPIKYDFVYDFFQGVAMVRIGAQYGLIDTSGKEITPVKYDLIDDNDFYNHRPAAALLNGKWGFINEKGEEVIPFIYEDTTYFHKDYVAVRKMANGVLSTRKENKSYLFCTMMLLISPRNLPW